MKINVSLCLLEEKEAPLGNRIEREERVHLKNLQIIKKGKLRKALLEKKIKQKLVAEDNLVRGWNFENFN